MDKMNFKNTSETKTSQKTFGKSGEERKWYCSLCRLAHGQGFQTVLEVAPSLRTDGWGLHLLCK